MRRIKRNAIQCNHCGDVIESEYTHDYKMCSCGTVAVDGGHDYLKRGFKNSPDDFTELAEYEEEDCKTCRWHGEGEKYICTICHGCDLWEESDPDAIQP